MIRRRVLPVPRLPAVLAASCLVAAYLVTGCVSKLGPLPAISRCLGISYPASTELTLLGAYTSLELTAQGKRTNPVVVTAGATAMPQIIVLSGSDPQWDLSRFPPDKVIGVIAYAWDAPVVTGVPANTPLRLIDRYGGPDRGCGKAIEAYRGGTSLDALVRQAEALTGLKATRFRGGHHPSSLSADGVAPQPPTGRPRVEWDGAPAHPDRSQGDPFPGQERMASLVRSGAIRPATWADVDAYNRRVGAALSSSHLIAYANEHLQPLGTYVALKSFIVPENMAGAESRAFIVARGVPPPVDRDGRFSHNSYFFMDDGHATGPLEDDEFRRTDDEAPEHR